MQAEGHEAVDDDVERLTAVGASVFCHQVWSQAYAAFVCVVDRATWVCNRLTQVDFDLINVPERCPASYSVRYVVSHILDSWHEYTIIVDQWDNVLAIFNPSSHVYEMHCRGPGWG